MVDLEEDEEYQFECGDCGAVFADPVETTEEDIREHYEQAGFSRVPEYAWDRVGQYVCPECHSTNYSGSDD